MSKIRPRFLWSPFSTAPKALFCLSCLLCQLELHFPAWIPWRHNTDAPEMSHFKRLQVLQRQLCMWEKLLSWKLVLKDTQTSLHQVPLEISVLRTFYKSHILQHYCRHNSMHVFSHVILFELHNDLGKACETLCIVIFFLIPDLKPWTFEWHDTSHSWSLTWPALQCILSTTSSPVLYLCKLCFPGHAIWKQ